ncbi:MAG: hypothetical protein JWP77_922 [Polaromonas sp.]|jgi:hypothetical protein|nr:hypothetical protein [Polaromonas sp.]
MFQGLRFAAHAGACLAVVMLAACLNGEEPLAWSTWAIGLALGVYSAGLEAGWRLPRLVWQSPALFRNVQPLESCRAPC